MGARGGRLLPRCGASGVGRSPCPDHSSFRACGRDPLPTGCRCAGLRAWGPVTNPTARTLASWLCALWGQLEGAPGGGRLLPGCGASGVRRSPTPVCPSFGACGRGPLPTGCWCEGCRRGDTTPTPQRALLRAALARCGGGTRAPGGCASCLGVGLLGSGALPPPTARPFRRAAGDHYPLAVDVGGAGVETRHQPHSAHSCELALRAVGAARGRPGGGASCLGVGRPGSGAPPAPSARLLGRAAGAHYPLAVGARGAGVGTRHQPHRSGALRPLVLLGVRPGPTTHWLWMWGVRAWGPVTEPIARALAS